MNPSCRDLGPLVSLRAAGALSPDEAATVEAHLAGCAACRVEAERDAEVLGLAALPPISEAERLALDDLPARTLRALRRRSARRVRTRKVVVAALVAAAALAAITTPLLRLGPGPGAGAHPERTWQEPDMVALWNESALVYDDTAAQQGATIDDAALAALDAGAGE